MIKFTINLNPVPKKNSQEIMRNKLTGKPFIAQGKAYRDYEREAGWYVPRIDVPIDFPVNVKMVFYRKDKRRVDLVNLQECCLDVLVKYGILKDDNFGVVATMDGSRVEIDRYNPRTEVSIMFRGEEDGD